MATCASSLFSSTTQQIIKISGGDFVAISGSETIEKLITNDLRIPFTQILKSKIVLKEGQTNYLLNHLGMGDNATFVAIKPTYNTSSVNEEDNYLEYSYYDDLTKIYYMDQLLVLTGNSTHRIPQLYLTNPNTKYKVTLDVMIANIDDTYNYFNDTLNQTGTSFVNLELGDIKTHVVGESIVIYDKSDTPKPLIYIILYNINSIERYGQVLEMNESSRGTIFLKFLTEEDAAQAHSLINYVMSNSNININTMSPVEDLVAPVLSFWSNVGGSGGTGSYITFNGATAGVPYDTSDGPTFSTSISLSTWGVTFGATYAYIDGNRIVDLMVSGVVDNRDGILSITGSDVSIISGVSGSSVTQISVTGSYTVGFNISDIALNNLDNVILTLDVTI